MIKDIGIKSNHIFEITRKLSSAMAFVRNVPRNIIRIWIFTMMKLNNN